MDLYNGDCLDVMAGIPDGSVDAVIVDPPYGQTSLEWDRDLDWERWWQEVNRIKKQESPVCIFGQEPFSSHLRLSNERAYRYDIYWKKNRITNLFQVKRRVGKNVECISVFYDRQPVYNPQMVKHEGRPVSNGNGVKRKLGVLIAGERYDALSPYGYKDTGWRYPTQVLEIGRDAKNCKLHPTQKPVELMEWLVKTFTNPGQVVLDTCMGSGTTGVACKNLGCDFIGIERDEGYFEVARKRLLD